MMDPITQFASQINQLTRRLHALETAPRAPWTTQIIDQQDRLAETTKVLTYAPSGPEYTSTTTGSYIDWMDVGTMSVPTWATGAFALVTWSYMIYDAVLTDDINSNFRFKLGDNVFDGYHIELHVSGDLTDVRSVTMGVSFAGTFDGEGEQTATIQHADFFGPGNRWAATTATVVGVQVTFLGD